LGKNPEEIFSPEVRLALEHLPDLFDGSEVTTKGLPTYLHPEKVLGWIAYAYDKRNALSAPCGLIYSKLKDASAPSPSIKYMRTPESYLPNEYLTAIGRTPLQSEEPVSQDDYVDLRPERDETITEAIQQRFAVAMQTWEKKIGVKTPEAAFFNSFARNCWPVHFENDTLHVGVHNEYVRDQLQQRGAPQLAGQLNWNIQFVVAVETEGEDDK
jgi:hypothetical protein